MDYDKIDIDATIRENLKHIYVDPADAGADISLKTVVIGHGRRKTSNILRILEQVVIKHKELERPLNNGVEKLATAAMVCLVCDSTMKQIIKACEVAEIEMVKNTMKLEGLDVEFRSIGTLSPVKPDRIYMEDLLEDLKSPEVKGDFKIKGCPSDFNQKSNRPKWLNRR